MPIPEVISGAEETGYPDWSGLDHMSFLGTHVCEVSSIRMQALRAVDRGFSRSVRAVGHKNSVNHVLPETTLMCLWLRRKLCFLLPLVAEVGLRFMWSVFQGPRLVEARTPWVLASIKKAGK